MKSVQIGFAVSCAMVLGFVAGNYRVMHESDHRISQVKHARDVNLVVQEIGLKQNGEEASRGEPHATVEAGAVAGALPQKIELEQFLDRYGVRNEFEERLRKDQVHTRPGAAVTAM